MEELIRAAAEACVLAINAAALLFVVVGTVEAFVVGVKVFFGRGKLRDHREAWLRYGHWLVAALAFQLGADIIETSIAPTWEDLGQLAVIAVIRTFLDYFLKRDLEEAGGEETAAARS
jgi:uncharacterized membrane protein